MVGQTAIGFQILIVLVLWTPISLGFEKFDRVLRAEEDMVD